MKLGKSWKSKYTAAVYNAGLSINSGRSTILKQVQDAVQAGLILDISYLCRSTLKVLYT